MTKTNTTIEFFDKYAREYDAEQRALLPGYESILAMIADAYGHYAGAGAPPVSRMCTQFGSASLRISWWGRSERKWGIQFINDIHLFLIYHLFV